jgi:aspartate kinase
MSPLTEARGQAGGGRVERASNGTSSHRARPGDEPETQTVVWKFGGTSIADRERVQAAAQRMVDAQRAGRRVVAVLSAPGKSTDELTERAYAISASPPLRELDALLSVGEQISCALVAMAVHELGSRAVSLTGAQAGIHTDGTHGNARVREIAPERIREVLDTGAIVLVAGFQGVSPEGEVTTLGRGGSDASAVALAAALGVSECEIFTDVPAVFTADPRVVPEARRVSVVRHDEMLEMAEAGAGVLQPRSVELAAAHGVDVHVRSSFTTEPGTWIRMGRVAHDDEVAGVAHRDHDRVYSVNGVSPARLAMALGARGAGVGGMVARDGELRFTAPSVAPAEVITALAGIDAEVVVYDGLGTVSMIRSGIGRRPDVVARALGALDDAGIVPQFVTTTAGRLTVHVPISAVHDSVRLLHRVFVPVPGRGNVSDLRSAPAVHGERHGDVA